MVKQPAVFVGHGSPMHAIGDKDNVFVQIWKQMAAKYPKPKAIVAISAHWYISDARVTAQEHPVTIHDFGNFPQELFDVKYPAPGDPALARRVADVVGEATGKPARMDAQTWGLDHGTWSVLRQMYPEADIPVVQLSLDKNKPMDYHYRIGRALSKLRDEGIMIFGSGNIVHNFKFLVLGQLKSEPEPWAVDFANWVKSVTLDENIDRSDVESYPLLKWQEHKYGQLAQSYTDHFLPVLYTLGAAENGEKIEWDTELFDLGSFSMASFTVGPVN